MCAIRETTLSRRLRPGSYSFLVANTPVRIEPRIQDVEMDQGEWRISQRYLPGYGEMDLLLSFGMQARRGRAEYSLYHRSGKHRGGAGGGFPENR